MKLYFNFFQQLLSGSFDDFYFKVGFIGIHKYANIVLLAYICFPDGRGWGFFGCLCYFILNWKLAHAVLVLKSAAIMLKLRWKMTHVGHFLAALGPGPCSNCSQH